MLKKKSLGQNFLKSKSALSTIIGISNPAVGDIILEIGPGEGALTEELLKSAGKIIAVEKDRRLIPILSEKFADKIASGKLDLIEKDILDIDIDSLAIFGHPYKIIANIPYYITGQIIRKFLETEKQPESITILVQKEVADRITVKDGKESLLSLSVKVYGNPKFIKTVPRGAFSPQPNVDSAILHIDDISRKNFTGVDEKKFFEILRVGFSHKRKLLFSNLTVLSEKKNLTEVFGRCKINLKCRAEDIPLEKWLELTRYLQIETAMI